MRGVRMQDNGDALKLGDQQLNLGYIDVYIKPHGNHKPKIYNGLNTQKQKGIQCSHKEEKGIPTTT